MKLQEIYVPVFEKKEDVEAKIRQLRSDFGSRRTELECTSCTEVFTRRIGPNTSELNCPSCGHNRVRLAMTEKAKKKLIQMREALEVGDFKEAANHSLQVLSDLVGDNRPHVIPTIQEALAGLAAVEPGLGQRVRELSSRIKEGNGRKELSQIAEKMGFGHCFEDKK
jgi:predicted  nucleic acid-binding Zn-ribbon protein